MKQVIKINFTDFWGGFEKTNNYFYNLLSEKYDLEISKEPEIIIFSKYGKEYLRYKCIRIFYSAENERPDFSGCDYAMTFDYKNDPRHYRLPLYGLYFEERGGINILTAPRTEEDSVKILSKKTKFCCMVVSNGLSKKRIEIFEKLSRYKQVDSGGRYLNNVGGPISDKLEFIKDYKFVMTFENSAYPGYTSEKIIDPFFVRSIPIFWGNNLIGRDFNKNAFVNFNDYKSDDDFIDKIIEIDTNDALAVKVLSESVFPNNVIPSYILKDGVLAFLCAIIDKAENTKPVAKSFKQFTHVINRKKLQFLHYINVLIGKNYR